MANLIFSEPDICIFVDGDYWHANPRFYKKNEMISYPRKKIRASDKRKKDSNVTRRLRKDGFHVLRLWEYDIYNNTEKCLQKIIKAIKESKR